MSSRGTEGRTERTQEGMHVPSLQESTSDPDAGITASQPGIDGGWAWMICAACFFVHFIVDGMILAFGVILLTLLEHFEDSSRSKASWVGSALLGACMGVGPVVGLLLQFYSFRQVMMLGSFVASLGFGLSVFAPNIEMLIFTYGFLGGAGFGLVGITSTLAVGLRFTRKRAVATGIAMSGSGAGTFALSFLTERLIHAFGLHGAMLIVTGIVSNLFVFAAVVRPLVKTDTPLFPCCLGKGQQNKNTTKSDMVCMVINNDNTLREPLVGVKLGLLTEGQYDKHHCSHSLVRKSFAGVINEHVRPWRSAENIVPSTSTDRMYNSDVHLQTKDVGRQSVHKLYEGVPQCADNPVSKLYLGRPMLRKDIFYSGSIYNLPEYQRDPNVASFIKSMTSVTPSADDEHSKDKASQETNMLTSCKRLFCDKTFLMLLVVMASWTGQSTTLTYLPDLAVSRGVSTTSAALLLSAVGVTNIVGRVAAGLLANHPNIDSVLIYTCILFLCGLTSGLFPFCASFWMFVVCSCVFGACSGACASLRTIILADVLGIDKLTHSFGMVLFVQGVLFTVGPPISVAVVYGIGGLICALVRPVQRCFKNPSTEKDSGKLC